MARPFVRYRVLSLKTEGDCYAYAELPCVETAGKAFRQKHPAILRKIIGMKQSIIPVISFLRRSFAIRIFTGWRINDIHKLPVRP